MIVSLFLCIALLSPCVLSSIENCTATTCLRCLPGVTPNCTVSPIDGDDSLQYNVYCEPPSSSPNCEERNVTGLNDYCVVLLHKSNMDGQWNYQSYNFQFQPQHNCSNTDGNPVLANCLNLYSEVTAVEEIGQNIVCRCYEDDCQKRINITVRVTGNIVTNVSSSTLISPTTSSIIANGDRTSSSVTIISVSADDDRTLLISQTIANGDRTSSSVTIISVSADDDSTLLISQTSIIVSLLKTSSILPTLSAIGTQSSSDSIGTQSSSNSIGTQSSSDSIVSTVLPTNGPNTLTDALIIVISCLAVISFLAIALLLVISFCYCYKNFSKRKRSHQIHLHAAPPTIEMIELTEEPPLPFQLLQTIGRGKFGSVWKALYNDETVAIKIFTPHHRLSWQNEKYIHSLDSTPHENILRFIGSEVRGSGYNVQYFTITEYYHLGSLHQFLRHNSLTWEQAWNMMYTVTSGLAHLHSTTYCNSEGFIAEKYAVVHRDVKTANVLVKHETGQCVLGDLGLALLLDPAADDRQLANSGQVGTFRYMAPEALDARLNLRDIESFKQIDVYALALVLWEICTRCEFDKASPVQPYQPPFFDLVGERPTLDQMKEIVVVAKQRPSLSGSWYAHKNMRVIANIMTESWDEDSEARLTAANIISRLENLEGSKARLKSESNSPMEDTRCEFVSPTSEMSQISQSSLHKNVRLSASFSGSSSTHPVVPSIRYSVGTVNNADIPNNLTQSIQDLQASYELEPFSSVANMNSRHSSIHPNPVSIPHAQTQNGDESGDLRHLNIDKTTGQTADDNHSVHSDNN